MHYFLLDANVLVPYYCEEEDPEIKRRVAQLVAAKAAGKAFLFVPNFCVAEVLRAFARKCWREKLYGKKVSDAREAFSKFRAAFLDDIVQSKVFYSYELSRRHILKTDAICETASKLSFREGSAPSAFDVLIIAMGCNLMYIHGRENFHIITAERPIYDVCREHSKTMPRAIVIRESNIPKELLR